ncbi:hypothetical protein PV10_05240 [Exophiala mesophila]|uniref:Thioesterase domain-containing protein n=1 Tax=Exophiala mesophila TaxID=212818 RepID=A0A0D1ZJI5_EXOME|nr:uncharacterized protein PV10_05240 [Exophiala mesophila]KIV94084.1 hypothetical protein PV10_05240 [Exophiala mesophila]
MSVSIGLDDFVPWLAAQSAPEKDVQFFQRTPWTRKLIENPLFRAVPCPTRLITPGTSHNAFIAKTINKPSCVQHWLMLTRKQFSTPKEVARGTLAQSRFSPNAETYNIDDSEFIMLLDVGEDLDGFAGRVQGGVLCAILDEALSICVEYHRQASSSSRAPLYTVQLNTTFRDGVNTPGLIAVKSWIVAKEGRKWLIRGQICDAQGHVLTQAEGIWVSAAENKL